MISMNRPTMESRPYEFLLQLQYSCLENPMDRGAWWATVHGIARVRYDLATKLSYY